MTAFVTGASGFIGSNLVARLIDEGWQVICLTRKNDFAIKNERIKVVIGDLLDRESFRQEIKRADVVFNLAAALPHHKLTEQQYFETNVQGLKNLLASLSSQHLKRFVHVSTVGIYGPSGGHIISERSALHLTDAYSRSKSKAEVVLRRYAKINNLLFTIIRPTIGYGPGDTRPGFYNLFRLVGSSKFIQIGNGENFFHTIYVENLVSALVVASLKSSAIGEDFIIGDDPCPTMKQIVEEIYKAERIKPIPFYLPKQLARIMAIFFDLMEKIGFPAPLNTRRFEFVTENRRYSTKKAKEILGFQPEISLATGIRKTYQWYKKRGYLE